jgi:hypothetical protein
MNPKEKTQQGQQETCIMDAIHRNLIVILEIREWRLENRD